MEMARFTEPIDCFALEDWQGGEIYENEEYLEMDNDDIVLLEKDSIIEYLKDNFEITLEMLDDFSIKKIAERG